MCEITMKAIGHLRKKKKICDGNGRYVDLGFDLGSRCPSLTRWDQTSEVPLSRDALKSNFRGSSQSSRLGIKLQRFLSVESPWNQISEIPLCRVADEWRRLVVKLQIFLSVETPWNQTSEVPLSRDAL